MWLLSEMCPVRNGWWSGGQLLIVMLQHSAAVGQGCDLATCQAGAQVQCMVSQEMMTRPAWLHKYVFRQVCCLVVCEVVEE